MTSIATGTVELVPIDSVKPHPDNYREGDIGAICTSIERNGFYGHIIIQASTRLILAGNHRWQAAKQLGMLAIPAQILDIDQTAADRILAVDNRSSDLATNRDAELASLLQRILAADDDLAGTGYDTDDLDDLIQSITPPDDRPIRDPEPTRPATAQAKWHTEPGQVWHAGRQRLIISDATSAAAYATVEPGSIDLVFTDPPYGVAYESRGRAMAIEAGKDGAWQHDPIENDDTSIAALEQILDAAFDHALTATKPGASWYVTAPPGPLAETFLRALNSRCIARQMLHWIKDALVLGRSDYHYRNEPIIYGWTPGAAHYFTRDRTQDTIWTTALAEWQASKQRKLNRDTIAAILDAELANTWEVPRPKRSAEHPTMKPVELVARAIRNSTRPGAKILDPFVGSGTTLLAAEQLDRSGIGIELDPGYAATALDRLEQIGLTPERTE